MPSTLTTTPHLTFQSSVHYLTGERSRMCTMYYFHIPPSIPSTSVKSTSILLSNHTTLSNFTKCRQILTMRSPSTDTKKNQQRSPGTDTPGLDLTEATSTSLEFDIGGFRGQTLKSEGPQKRTPGIPLPTFQLHL